MCSETAALCVVVQRAVFLPIFCIFRCHLENQLANGQWVNPSISTKTRQFGLEMGVLCVERSLQISVYRITTYLPESRPETGVFLNVIQK